MPVTEKQKQAKIKYNETIKREVKMHRLMERIRKREAATSWRIPPKPMGEFVVHKKMSRQGWEDNIPDPTKGPIRMGL